jgi:hypothetical protein
MDVKITTELLYRGAFIFALLDAVFIPLLVWRVSNETFRRLKWPLIIAAAIVWFAIWFLVINTFWGTVYSYVFPAWMHTWLPWIALVIAGGVSFGIWTLSLRIHGKSVLAYCFLGGILGSLTHIWAVYRGIVTKPPMLQGASPLVAVVIAFFEYIFYWCTILLLAKIMDWMQARVINKSARHPSLISS